MKKESNLRPKNAIKPLPPPAPPKSKTTGWFPQDDNIKYHMKRYNFYLPEKIMDGIAQLAKKEGISYSEMIRNVLRDYLITHDLPSLTRELKAGYNPIKKVEVFRK